MAIIRVHGLFLFSHIFLIIDFPAAIIASPDADALLKLKTSFINPMALISWQPGTEPCEVNRYWLGVKCENGVVSGLRLGALGLSGRIDTDALAAMPGLRSVAFMGNLFAGPIPDFHQAGALKGLYISDNQFSGVIPPDYFRNMAGLKKVWMSRNKFTGPIPPSLSQLSQLMELHLDGNQFSGKLPPLDQKSLSSLNVSFNNLEGEIPVVLKRFSAESFLGNPKLCGASSGRSCGPQASEEVDSTTNGLRIALACLSAVAILLLVALIAVFLTRRRRNKMRESPMVQSFDRPIGPPPPKVIKKDAIDSTNNKASPKTVPAPAPGGSSRRRDIIVINDEKGVFGLADLMKAAAEVLGNGALGSSYRATMASGLSVVVKRVKEMARMGRDEFDEEMRRLARLRHKNILPPLAYHYRKEEKLLVSEYQKNGSLLYVLHSDRGIGHTALTWPIRLKIIQGVAQGLGFLHKELSALELPHGDLKSSNVLLGPDFEPVLSDYGFYLFTSNSQAVQALAAYKAPEAALHQQISPKCDVFCLGIIILEVLTGKFPSQYSNGPQGGTDLVQWVRSAIPEGREADLLDPDFVQEKSSIGQMVQLLRIGSACTEVNPNQRLELSEAIRQIEAISVDGAERINIG